jgi:hypothetical protein
MANLILVNKISGEEMLLGTSAIVRVDRLGKGGSTIIYDMAGARNSVDVHEALSEIWSLANA